MPSLEKLQDFVTHNIGNFRRGVWDYVGLAQRYPKYEALAQLAPRKTTETNRETTVEYQTRTDAEPHGHKPGEPIQPKNQKKAIRRKVSLVKVVDEIGWTEDQDDLLGKSDEHINRHIQLDMVDFDLRWWEFLEHSLLRLPNTITPEDDDPMFGFPAWLTDKSGATANEFDLTGGQDPYSAGRPGGISVAQQPEYTNPTAYFQQINDQDFFDKLDTFLQRRKLMRVVPNPSLIPDTPADVCYVQLKVKNRVSQYLSASNENMGMDAGRYRGDPTFMGVPITVWHATDSPQSLVKDTKCIVRLIDWNSFNYTVQSKFDRLIKGPIDVPLTPSTVYMTSEHWHQLTCDRPDRNLYMESGTPDLQP